MPDRPRRSRPARKRPVARPPAPTPPTDGVDASDGIPPAPSQNGREARKLTLDPWDLLGAGIVLLGAALRLASLSGQPLSPGEATNALDSLAVYQGHGASAAAGPLLIYGQAIIFALFGASDTTARLLAAVLGSAAVALPLYLQRELGRLGSRAAAFFLAVSPTLVFMSRQTDAAMPVAALGFAAVVFYHVAIRDSSRRALFACVISLALLVTAGPLAYYALVVFAAYLLLRGVLGRTAGPEAAARIGFVGPAGAQMSGAPLLSPNLRAAIKPASLLLAFVAVWLVATTDILSSFNGVQQGLVDGLAGFLATFVDASGRAPWYYLAVLASYEQAPLIFGVLGIVLFRRDALAGKLTFWALAVLVLGSISQARPIGLAPQIVIPLAVLAGAGADRVISALSAPDARRGLLAFAIGSTVILGGLGNALDIISEGTIPVTEALLAIPILVAALALAYSVMANGVGRTIRHAAVVALVVAILWGWRENFLLSYGSSANPAQLLVETATLPDVRTMASNVSLIAHEFAMDGNQADVLVSPELPPTVQWYLRYTPSVSIGNTPTSNTLVWVLPTGAAAPAGYNGQLYRLQVTQGVTIDSWKTFWRWYGYRESIQPQQSTNMMVYVRPIG